MTVAAACFVLFQFDPNQGGFYPICYFHQTTGLLCPGCGSLRALHQLAHGHVVAAVHLNVLLVCSLPLLGWWSIRSAIRKARNQPAHWTVRPAWLWCGLVVLLAFGVLRNLPFGQMAWLAP
jgi:hypothetical protein